MRVKQLFLYPVKSLRGIAVNQAELTHLGLKHDRAWMIIDQNNKFVTQRKFAEMVLIKTSIDSNFLILSAKNLDDIHIPLISQDRPNNTNPNYKNPNNEAFLANVWGDECRVVEEKIDSNGANISEWISQALNTDKQLRLVRMAENTARPQSKPERFGEDTTTQFADAVPYLICHQSSLDELNKSLLTNDFEAAVMEQFRPNIVIENSTNSQLAAFEEHQIKQLKNDDYCLLMCDACQRCIVPTININTAKRHPQQEPYKTLVGINPMPDNPKAAAFGQNAILDTSCTNQATQKQSNKKQMIQINDALSVV